MTVLMHQYRERMASFLKTGLDAEDLTTEVIDRAQDLVRFATSGLYETIVIDADRNADESMRLCAALRRSGVELPIMLTGEPDDSATIVAALRSGADDYLSVPFCFDVFLARIEALRRRTGVLTTLDNEARVGDLVIDRSRHEVRRGGEPVVLTPIEYRLLDYLMSGPGRVFSRTRIHERVWGYDRDPLTNVVEVYIRRLRAKIDDGAPVRLIHTVRGFGYKVECPQPAKTPVETPSNEQSLMPRLVSRQVVVTS